jgi:hypothetical protein
MANRPITITGINPDNTLILSDNGNTNVDPGDTVTWQIGPISGVATINAINDKSTPVDVFNPDPAQLANSSSWQGTVNPYIARGTAETYTINYTNTAGVQYTFDPTIQVNP